MCRRRPVWASPGPYTGDTGYWATRIGYAQYTAPTQP